MSDISLTMGKLELRLRGLTFDLGIGLGWHQSMSMSALEGLTVEPRPMATPLSGTLENAPLVPSFPWS